MPDPHGGHGVSLTGISPPPLDHTYETAEGLEEGVGGYELPRSSAERSVSPEVRRRECVCVCVCVCEKEREREREGERYVYMCV